MKKKFKIGILGGTLDPIHNGHLIIAQTALEQLELDKVLFMPSGNPPHKQEHKITDCDLRKKMIELSIADNPYFEFSDYEYERNGIIYTSDTLQLLTKQYTDWEIYFIMGADSLLTIEEWNQPQKIFELANIVVADRDNSNQKILDKIKYFQDKYSANIFYIKSPMINISSTMIREMVHHNYSLRYLVNKDVEKYIQKYGLYKEKLNGLKEG